jgi:predicted transcriptional regulator
MLLQAFPGSVRLAKESCMRTIRAEIDDATASALDELVQQDGRPRSHLVGAAVKAFIDFSPAARLALFAIDGLAAEDERAVAMALIGQMAIDAYQGMLAARQGVGDQAQDPDIEAFLDL